MRCVVAGASGRHTCRSTVAHADRPVPGETEVAEAGTTLHLSHMSRRAAIHTQASRHAAAGHATHISSNAADHNRMPQTQTCCDKAVTHATRTAAAMHAAPAYCCHSTWHWVRARHHRPTHTGHPMRHVAHWAPECPAERCSNRSQPCLRHVHGPVSGAMCVAAPGKGPGSRHGWGPGRRRPVPINCGHVAR
jgi:hypothetical protein